MWEVSQESDKRPIGGSFHNADKIFHWHAPWGYHHHSDSILPRSTGSHQLSSDSLLCDPSLIPVFSALVFLPLLALIQHPKPTYLHLRLMGPIDFKTLPTLASPEPSMAPPLTFLSIRYEERVTILRQEGYRNWPEYNCIWSLMKKKTHWWTAKELNEIK